MELRSTSSIMGCFASTAIGASWWMLRGLWPPCQRPGFKQFRSPGSVRKEVRSHVASLAWRMDENTSQVTSNQGDLQALLESLNGGIPVHAAEVQRCEGCTVAQLPKCCRKRIHN